MSNKLETGPLVKTDLVALLRRIARQIQAMNDEDVERLIAGEKFEIRLSEKRSRKSGRSPSCSEDELDLLRRNLLKARSREIAREMIDQKLHKKADLFALARTLEIPMPKNATSEHLKERLVEATVGFRVRADAVRGVNPSSPNRPKSSEQKKSRV